MKLNIGIFPILVLHFLTNSCSAQNFTEGIWKISENKIVYNADTILLFTVNGSDNFYHLTSISYNFEQTGEYSGTSVDGTPINGTWSANTSILNIDGHESEFQFINNNEFLAFFPFIFPDSTGNQYQALSILHFYNSEATSISSPVSRPKVTINPIPCNYQLNILIDTAKQETIHLKLINSFGICVFENRLPSLNPQKNIQINTTSFPSGFYILSIEGEGWSDLRNLTIVHK